jgi:hypothetical protein
VGLRDPRRLAGWAVLVLLLAPGMRWFFRRRIKLVMRQIGGRLRSSCPPSS